MDEGVTSIHAPTRKGFRIHLPGTTTPAIAEKLKWHVNWEALPKGKPGKAQCAGRSKPGQWTDHKKSMIRLDIKTKCGFDKVKDPVYFTSLVGKDHESALGETSIFAATETGFRVFVSKKGLNAQLARKQGWYINWSASERNARSEELCSGTAKGSKWRRVNAEDNGSMYYMDVDTTGCNFDSTPIYIASAGGRGHLRAVGTTSIQQASRKGFRIYLKGVDPKNTHINWKASPYLQPEFQFDETEDRPIIRGHEMVRAIGVQSNQQVSFQFKNKETFETNVFVVSKPPYKIGWHRVKLPDGLVEVSIQRVGIDDFFTQKEKVFLLDKKKACRRETVKLRNEELRDGRSTIDSPPFKNAKGDRKVIWVWSELEVSLPTTEAVDHSLSVFLKSREFDSAREEFPVYPHFDDPTHSPLLIERTFEPFQEIPEGGVWQLDVGNYTDDTGTLDSWTLELTSCGSS